ncbi:hypothetical protein MVEN_01956800 [Mycena venus]|uniref:Uncharacterized protein n=1 Tax=Mycena venus TaxID=2733690 RepID=A0A8H6XFU3_9AGAR|nr:hypothetical protein MVEN_01956800 [Mycena venus]
MFSKFLTFGLAALTFVGAAPASGFQEPMAISCSVNVQSVSAGAATYSLEPGTYEIRDFRTNSLLQYWDGPTAIFYPLFIYQGADPGPWTPYGYWKVQVADDGAFTISDLSDRGAHVYFNARVPSYNGTIITDPDVHEAVPFAIQPAGGNTFVIKSVNENLVWTLKDPESQRSEACLA